MFQISLVPEKSPHLTASCTQWPGEKYRADLSCTDWLQEHVSAATRLRLDGCTHTILRQLCQHFLQVLQTQEIYRKFVKLCAMGSNTILLALIAFSLRRPVSCSFDGRRIDHLSGDKEISFNFTYDAWGYSSNKQLYCGALLSSDRSSSSVKNVFCLHEGCVDTDKQTLGDAARTNTISVHQLP